MRGTAPWLVSRGRVLILSPALFYVSTVATMPACYLDNQGEITFIKKYM